MKFYSKRVRLMSITVVGLVWGLFVGSPMAEGQQSGATTLRILHVMSYHLPWEWNVDQLKGFKHGLNYPNVRFEVFQMDTKRNSSESWKQKTGEQARALIESWKPDLVYTNDDNAQAFVAKQYVNGSIPFVFSGVNASPDKYGFTGSSNVSGVLEQEHFVPTVNLLRKMVPSVKKIAVILDDGPTWPGVVSRMRAQIHQLEGITLHRIEKVKTYAEFKTVMAELQDTVDAVAMLGVFTFKNDQGVNVDFTEVLKWTAENSKLPDFSFWGSRVPHGTLCAVTVSGYAQGLAAGQIARGILVDGRSPASFLMEPTLKGKPVVSLARAKKLGINIDTDILLSAQVIETFEWKK